MDFVYSMFYYVLCDEKICSAILITSRFVGNDFTEFRLGIICLSLRGASRLSDDATENENEK